MKHSIIIQYNVFDDVDVDERNDMVDDAIAETKIYNEDATATDIAYEVVSCLPNGDAVIKATFEYESDDDEEY